MAGVFPHRVPKAFPLHEDTRQFTPDPRGQARVIEELRNVAAVEEALSGGGGPLPSKPVRRFYRRLKAQFNDPICLFAVIETMLLQQRGTYIRPDYVLVRVQQEWPLYHWDMRMLGRMLSGIQTACAEDYQPEYGPLDAPIGRGRDSRGTYYCIDPKGGNEGYGWLLQARKRAMKLAHDLMYSEQHGAYGEFFNANGIPVWNQPKELYVVEWLQGCRLRTNEFYEAQQTSDTFHREDRTRSRVDPRDPLA